jgi:23S rRNA pseudouridine1911/1915/1917 synthase
LGDKVYRFEGGPTLGRHALHCRSLAFKHPITGRPMCLEADLPADLRSLYHE